MNALQTTSPNPAARLVKASINSNTVMSFPATENLTHVQRGWICNVSERFSIVNAKQNHLQIKTNEKHSQFDLITKLLLANTCHVIYFDAQFTPKQLNTIRMLQSQSRTELFNAKMAYLFSTPTLGMRA